MESEIAYEALDDLGTPNTAWAKTIGMVGHNQRVLEFGCRSGAVTEALAGRGCEVVGIERDPDAATRAEQWATDVLVLDLDVDDYAAKLEGRQFDVLLFGDTPEHLRNPLAALRSAKRLLAPGGYAVLSLANIAHVDMRLALLDGRFDFGGGLVDGTRLRFFTRESITALLHEAGFVDIEWDRVIAPAFTTEIDVDPSDYPSDVIDRALSHTESETYRFVVRAVIDDGDAAVARLSEQCRELSHQAADMTRAATLARGELEQARADLDDERAKLKWWMRDHHRVKQEWMRLTGEVENLSAELQAARDEATGAEARATAATDREAEAHAQAARTAAELGAVYATKTFRLLGPLRQVYARIRSIGR